MPHTIRDDAALDALTLAVTLHKLTAGMSNEMVNELRAVGARLEDIVVKVRFQTPGGLAQAALANQV
jgi:hypothetical protein